MHLQKYYIENKWIITTAIAVLMLLIYSRAATAGFVTDFTGLHMKMQGQGLGAALHSFGFPSLMPLLNIIYWLLYKVFGLNAWGWFLFAVIISSLTLATFYGTISILLEDFGFDLKNRRFIALVTVALVLTSPYQVEAMIWKVGLGHLMSVALFIIAFHHLILYLNTCRTIYLISMLTALMLSLFCFEWGLVFPMMASVVLLGYWRLGKLTINRGGKIFIWTLVPVAVYLILTKLVLGYWLGHYDTETEMNLKVPTMISTTFKYLIKHLFFTPFYSTELKQSFYGLADKFWFLGVAVFLLVSMLGYWISKGRQLTLKAVVLCCLLLGLVLVSGLHFHDLLLSENDRYGSLFIYFFAFMLALFMGNISPWRGYTIFFLYLVVQIVSQQILVNQWEKSQDQVAKITHTYNDLNVAQEDQVLILNLPENYRGTFMFRDFSGENPLSHHLTMHGIVHPQLDIVAQYNLPYKGQAYSGKWIADGRIRLEAQEWGSWWWSKGLGLGKYETDQYIFEPKSKAMEVQLKPGHSYTKLIYFNGERWIQL